MDWAQVLTVFAIVATNLITVITLYIHQDNKMTTIISAIQSEMKDFHLRLATQDRDFHVKMAQQDLEFKTRLCAIEEKRK